MLAPDEKTYFDHLSQAIRSKGWNRLTRKDILKDCPEPLKKFSCTTSPKQAIWIYLFWHIDQRLEQISQGISSKVSLHDALFEGIMTLFDTLQPYKDFLKLTLRLNAHQTISYDLLKHLDDRCQFILENAGISTANLKGVLRIKVMQLLVAASAYVWLKDESEDSAETMSFIDQKLRQTSELAGYVGL